MNHSSKVNTLQGHVLLNGKWVASASGEFKEIGSPADGTVIGKVPLLTKEEVDQAVQGAASAQKSWAEVPLHQRGDLLLRWADRLEEASEAIGELIMREVGKKRSSAIGEVKRTANLIRYTVEEGKRKHGELMTGDSFYGGSREKTALVARKPLGVILAISPFNYPVNLAAAKIAPALITGNAVVFKPATQGALSGLQMIKALEEAGLPEGVVNVVTGSGETIGDDLVTHPLLNMITFTGGTETGKRISKLAGMIPVVLELGGKDPAIVLDDADLERAASDIVSGAFSYSGQRCTAIKRVLVSETIADELVEKIVENVRGLSVGLPQDEAEITPLINEKAADFVQGLIDEALKKGAALAVGNKREGRLIYPTVLDNVTADMKVARDEPFGPVLPIIRVKDSEEAIRLANESEYGLQASIFTEHLNKAFSIASQLEVGSVQINGRTERGPDHFPFLGIKNSGIGVQGIGKSIESMTREKVIVLNGMAL